MSKDAVHQDQIHVETIRKEQRHQKLHTEFSLNPRKKLHILPDKPMARKIEEAVAENSEFIKAFHKAREVPTKKYTSPQTESQVIGWVSTPLKTPDASVIFRYQRFQTDVTKHQESALRSK